MFTGVRPSAVVEQLSAMQGELAYLRAELATLEADGMAATPLLAEAKALVEALDATCGTDLRQELETLSEKLGPASGLQFADPDPAVNASFIVSRLRGGISKLVELIDRLTPLKPGFPVLEMLLMAGAGELIKAHDEIRRELEPLLKGREPA